jgi:hypothetical protein
VKSAEIYQPRIAGILLRRGDTSPGRKLWACVSLRGSKATCLRVEDRLDGAANFSSWKETIVFLLQECELWDIVENSQANLVTVPTDATLWQPTPKRT